MNLPNEGSDVPIINRMNSRLSSRATLSSSRSFSLIPRTERAYASKEGCSEIFLIVSVSDTTEA